MIYEIQFRSGGGTPRSVSKLIADSDEHAVARARALLQGGTGDGFEIRRGGRLVHVETLGVPPTADKHTPSGYWNRIRACLQGSLETGDLEQRRFLMLLAEQFLESVPDQVGPALHEYRVVLIDMDEVSTAETDLEAASDGEAFILASILANVCNETCNRFELWRGHALVGSGTHPFHSLSARNLRELSQREVVSREIALHDSRRSIAESRDLLKNVDNWLRASMYDA